MHTFLFRSYDLIVESDEADLIRDVKLDLHKARVKLSKIQERLQGVQEQAAAKCSCSPRRKPNWPRRSSRLSYRRGGKNEAPAPTSEA